MKQIIKIGLFAVVFSIFTTSALFSTHIMGSDMTTKCLGNNKYLVTTTLYRDCRGVPLNSPTFGAYAGNSGGSGCGSFTLSLTRKSITEVTKLCDTAKSACSPQNAVSSGNGVEKHVFEYIADFNTTPLNAILNNSNCCEVTFYLSECCRNGAITTGSAGEEFYTTSTIYLCNLNGACNNSPVNTNTPIFYACCNQPYIYNHGTIDSGELDSFNFKLIPSIKGSPNTSVTYASPFSFKYPLTPYCPGGGITCTPNPSANPPRGFYMDSLNGDLIFVPTNCAEVAVMAIEINEYRKIGGTWKIITKTRRDIQVAMTECAANNVPTITGNNKVSACPGDSICFSISTKDANASGQKGSNKVKMDWNNGIEGAVFTVNDTTAREPVGTFCWKIPKNASGTYHFSVHAKDDNCPRYAESYKGFTVSVNCGLGTKNISNFVENYTTLQPQPVKRGEFITVQNANLLNPTVEVYNLSGQLLSSLTMNSENQIAIPESMQSGLYVLVIKDTNYIIRKRCLIID
ncbi:MAG: T9SS type A sorting domain-containing protein [Bacteroidia bacterium]|nr:T9SS type A sorting domain-containing protein [Bacteroidia bacterium]